ncbi:GTPase, partial [Cellulomonas citrea]|uniref:GTPase n=1 Tax=Cellulomonas citrea TaxID=1909423 RepID=UPI001F39E5F1
MADGSDDPRRMLARPLAAASLLDAVRDLRRDAERTRFPLHLPGSASAAASRARLVDQLGEHLIPRLTQLSAPAVVVVAGSTGAGKSTLVNSLVGAEVSAAGVLRPTTRQAVLVHHPLDAALLDHHPVMDAVVVVAHEAVPRGIALLDAPDLDSVVEENRDWAHRLLESADLWLFVTTATRYGDALPWQVLGAAAERGTTVAMVLNRVPAASLSTVRRDLLDRMRERGLADAPLFTVPDAGPQTGPLEPSAVAPITRWMTTLAGPDRARTVVARTLHGALGALRGWVEELAAAVQDQADAAQDIERAITAALEPVRAAAVEQVRAGRVADGGVRARWLELTARGGALAKPVSGRGAVRGSARDARGRAVAVRPLLEDLEAGVALTLVVAGERGRA